MPRFAANLGFLWADRPLLQRIDAAAAAGFRAVELHWPYDIPALTLRERLAFHGLKLLGINTAPGDRDGDFGLGAVPGRNAQFRASFDQALAYAQQTGAGAIHVMAGVVEAGDEELAHETFLDNLAYGLPLAENAGITLLLEPINRRDKPGYFYERIEDAIAIIQALRSPALRLMFDCYHVGLVGTDVVAALHEAMPWIGHVQIASVPHRAEPDEGDLDYAAVFAALDALGYGAWVGAEYKPRGETDAGLGWLRPYL